MQQTLHNPLQKILAEKILKALPQHDCHLALDDIASMINLAPDMKMGHFAFGPFLLAKTLKMAPAKLATHLAEQIACDEIIAKARALGPYLNFFITPKALGQLVVAPALDGETFKRSLITSPKRLMVEYSQPNTHKELHVGHMRNLCLGNALVRLNRYIGHTVYAVTYPGDVGTHVAKCLWYLKHHYKGQMPTTDKGAWLGQMYSKAHNLLEDQRGSELEEKNRQELTAILKQLESKSGPYYEQWVETRQWSIDLMKEVYKWADVEFDRWFFESECDGPSLELARDLYQKGLLVESQGAIGMDLTENKLGFCLLIKSDGTGLYATKDVLLAQLKFKDYKLDQSIYIVDKRQALHFKQVFRVLEKLNFASAKNCYHLEYDFVELPDGAMSSRKGNIVPLTTLVESMEKTIKDNYLNRYQDSWSKEEINQCAHQIAQGAIKYGMIRMDNNRKIVFDLPEWLKLDGETGPYLQYVCARIHSLQNKMPEVDINDSKNIDWSLLKEEAELALMSKMNQFNNVAISAATQFKTPLLCAYLYDLGKLYNAFYHDCPVAKAQTPELSRARLALSVALEKTMAFGLSLLGIPTPSRM